MFCPLCHSSSTFYHQDKRRQYFQCGRCELVFVSPEALPTRYQEEQEYRLHENHLEDAGYRRFLMRLAMPLLEVLDNRRCLGMDFGCGPAPLLRRILEKSGHSVNLYDPYFYPDTAPLSLQYDFISCSEAMEHFHQPAREIALFDKLLKPGSWLAIMTKRVLSKEKFKTWHYKNDMTHVSFFSEATFNYIGKTWDYKVQFVDSDVVLLQKQ
ncbi:class I SAM-dependent methyltransferase [Alteromonas pelagimontana]|uniref:Class I SAM-dependent methyltransferase n=1 Tax=Alteromonas pelagimontana TaxID=1858656 RepID=A0A6M4MDS8_9ALTE|nr:class I SAM-dependent methyltransferase [Alteromonas pelagimontana]QJR80988.1 class I SAM-dependent methyltransferase [Alteromonas pelagimontana]